MESKNSNEIGINMPGKIIIDAERCKGCGLCVSVCPKGCIKVSSKSNSKGYFAVEFTNNGCTGCTNCALTCPDAAITVMRESNVVSVEDKKKRNKLMKETKA